MPGRCECLIAHGRDALCSKVCHVIHVTGVCQPVLLVTFARHCDSMICTRVGRTLSCPARAQWPATFPRRTQRAACCALHASTLQYGHVTTCCDQAQSTHLQQGALGPVQPGHMADHIVHAKGVRQPALPLHAPALGIALGGLHLLPWPGCHAEHLQCTECESSCWHIEGLRQRHQPACSLRVLASHLGACTCCPGLAAALKTCAANLSRKPCCLDKLVKPQPCCKHSGHHDWRLH